MTLLNRRRTPGALAVLLALTFLLVAIPTGSASAEEESADPQQYQPQNLGQTPGILQGIDIEDSHGISIWNHEMSIDRGAPFGVGKMFWSSIVDTSWSFYRAACAVSLWFIDWVLKLEWIPLIATPMISIGDAMQNVLENIGLIPTFLSFAFLIAGIWAMRGKVTTALYEILMASVIAALGAGILADPVRLVAGHDGLVVTTAQGAQRAAAELAGHDTEGMTPDQIRAAQTGALVDVFIRQPTQVINYGVVVDGTECEATYDKVVADGPYGIEDDIRDAIAECDKNMGDYAANPSIGMAMSAYLIGPAGLILLVLGVGLGGTVIKDGVNAMFQSMKAIVTLILGVLPGGARGSLLLTVSDVLVDLGKIIYSTVILALFLLAYQEIFTGGDVLMASGPYRFFVAAILIVLFLFVYWRWRGRIRAMPRRIADFLAQRPGGQKKTVQPARLPDPAPRMSGPTIAGAASAMTNLANLFHMRRTVAAAGAVAPTIINNTNITTGFFGDNPDSGGEPFVFPGPGPGSGPGPLPGPWPGPWPGPGPGSAPGPRPNPGPEVYDAGWVPNRPYRPGGYLPAGGGGGLPPGSSGTGTSAGSTGSRILNAGKKTAGTLVRAGTSAALAYGTGGASVPATRALGALSAARRAVLHQRTTPAAITPGPTAKAGRPTTTPPPAPKPGKTPTAPVGKTSAPLGQTSASEPQVQILKPGDEGYQTTGERLAAASRRTANNTDPQKASADAAERLRRATGQRKEQP